MSSNPYEAPRTPVGDLIAQPVGIDLILDEPRRVPAGNGWRWIVVSWDLLKAAPGAWAVLMLLVFGVSIAAQFIPFLGGLLQQAVNPFAAAAVAVLGESIRLGRPANVGEIIDQVTPKASQLGFLALVMAGVTLVMAIIMMVAVFSLMRSGGAESQGVVFVVALILVVIIVFPLIMLTYFAPVLIVLHGRTFSDAMRLSFHASARNMWPFLVFGLALIPLAIVATLPILLGWFVLIPLVFITPYAAYRDIFFED